MILRRPPYFRVVLAFCALAATGCVWLKQRFDPERARRNEIVRLLHAHVYDVPAEAPLLKTFTNIERQTGVTIVVDRELRAVIEQIDPRLPSLRTLPADELLTLVREIVPPQARFDYEYGPSRTLVVHLPPLPEET